MSLYSDRTRAIIESLRVQFPVIGPLVLEEITNAGFAYFSPDPVPTIQFPNDWDPDAQPRIIRHEVGHALQNAAAGSREALYHRGTGAYDVLRDFWTARGYPGTWEQARANADAQQAAGVPYVTYQRWRPQENFANCFAACTIPTTVEDLTWTETYGVPLDLAKMLAFFHNCDREMDDMIWTSGDIALTTDATGATDLVNIRVSKAFDPNRPLAAIGQRIGLSGTEATLPNVAAAAAFDANGAYATIHVRSDPVRNGTIYVRVSVLQ